MTKGTPIMTGDTYNGWANRETWAAALCLSNDEGLYRLATETAQEAFTRGLESFSYDFGPEKTEEYARNYGRQEAADALKDLVAELTSEDGDYGWSPTTRMMRDEIGSQWRVDWAAVADSFLEGMTS